MSSFDSFLIPDKLKKPIKELFQLKEIKRFLLALSGGSDSTAMLYTLLSLQKEGLCEFAIIHVDHGWRKESAAEALFLKKLAQELKLEFYIKVLNPKEICGNLEESCRRLRLAFFKEICKKFQYDAVILAHHQNDLAETVLKRILEGASLNAYPPMQKWSDLNGLTVLRPWLDIPKTAITEFLKQSQIKYFEDPTNLHENYLRGRMRSQLFPFYEEQFGKSITQPLVRLNQEWQECNDYFQNKWKHLFTAEKPWCYHLDCKDLKHPFERRWVLREWFHRLKIDISSSVIHTLEKLIFLNSANKQIKLKENTIEIDRKRLFVINDKKNSSIVNLCLGSFKWGVWQVKVEPFKPSFQSKELSGWKEAFSGTLSIGLPRGEFQLGLYTDLINDNEKQKLQKLWIKEKIPAFFRTYVPIISQEGKVLHEFLSLKPRNQRICEPFCCWINLEYETTLPRKPPLLE